MAKDAPFGYLVGESFHDTLRNIDIVSKVKPLLMQGYFLDQSGKIDYPRHMAIESPWLHVRYMDGQNCHLWHNVMFNVVFQQRVIPSYCHECYKVVIIPQTVVELFALHELQKRMNRYSKCGTEGDRRNTGRFYGGYWYNRGKEAGVECLTAVMQAITADDMLPGTGEDWVRGGKLFLKRGCSEFEQAVGPSDRWVIDPIQKDIEALMMDAFAPDSHPDPDAQPYATIKRRWIENAFKWGDKTYVKFTGGKPLYPAYVGYTPVLDAEPEKKKTNKPKLDAGPEKKKTSKQKKAKSAWPN